MSELTNDATQKLAVNLPLTSEQEKLVKQILAFTKKHINGDTPAIFTVYGDAGTGKSVVLAHLFNKIQLAARTEKDSRYIKPKTTFWLITQKFSRCIKKSPVSRLICIKKTLLDLLL